MKNEISAKKKLVKDIFSRMWFEIPEYQRPYVWTTDEVSELLEDITTAMQEDKSEKSRYFLGAFVCNERDPREGGDDVDYKENDLLDGQQRMLTLLLLFIVLRDISTDSDAIDTCEGCIAQKKREFKGIPERHRITFKIRDKTELFLKHLAKEKGISSDMEEIVNFAKKNEINDVSTENMINAIAFMKNFFKVRTDELGDNFAHDFLKFLLLKVELIYVAAENLGDAFLLFTILNNRGLQLRNSDILKATNLRAVEDEKQKEIYAKNWENMEEILGDNFDVFLGYLRTILVKEKQKFSLIDEYDKRVYDANPQLLRRGDETFKFIETNFNIYNRLIFEKNKKQLGDCQFDDLIYTMLKGGLPNYWIPPLLCYYNKFDYDDIFEFIQLLDKKLSADWINQETPTRMIVSMNNIIKDIMSSKNSKEILESERFAFNNQNLLAIFGEDIYRKRFTKYILLKLNSLKTNKMEFVYHSEISIEHILPRNPKDDSKWNQLFSESKKDLWLNKLGNLILIDGRRNSTLSNKEYSEKKANYFGGRISCYSHSTAVMNDNDTWTPDDLEANHNKWLGELKKHYNIT